MDNAKDDDFRELSHIQNLSPFGMTFIYKMHYRPQQLENLPSVLPL